MSENICRNCKWASWVMTQHAKPRVNPKVHGRCDYPMERVAMPHCATGANHVNERSKSFIWFDSKMQCRVWENKDA